MGWVEAPPGQALLRSVLEKAALVPPRSSKGWMWCRKLGCCVGLRSGTWLQLLTAVPTAGLVTAGCRFVSSADLKDPLWLSEVFPIMLSPHLPCCLPPIDSQELERDSVSPEAPHPPCSFLCWELRGATSDEIGTSPTSSSLASLIRGAGLILSLVCTLELPGGEEAF